MLFSNVCILTQKLLSVTKWFVVFHSTFSSAPSTSSASWLVLKSKFPVTLSWAVSSNWLRNLLFCCLFLRIETLLFLLCELIQISKVTKQQLERRTKLQQKLIINKSHDSAQLIVVRSQVLNECFLVSIVGEFLPVNHGREIIAHHA